VQQEIGADPGAHGNREHPVLYETDNLRHHDSVVPQISQKCLYLQS
jgi:hypothetical protein